MWADVFGIFSNALNNDLIMHIYEAHCIEMARHLFISWIALGDLLLTHSGLWGCFTTIIIFVPLQLFATKREKVVFF